MKQQSTKYFFLILLIAVLVVPAVALASWWNPLSWGIWNSIFHKPSTIQNPVACPMYCLQNMLCGSDGKDYCNECIAKAAGAAVVHEGKCATAIVGNDKDSHGCIGSAGYTWCAVKNKCLRTWEETCCVPENGVMGAPGNPEDLCCAGLIKQPISTDGSGTGSGTVGRCVKSTDQTAGWKTYTNTQGFYQLKYPANFILSTPNDYRYITIGSNETSEIPFFCYIEIRYNPDNLTAQDFANNNGVIGPVAGLKKNRTVEKITIDGVEAWETTMDNLPSDVSPVAENTLNDSTIFVVKNNKVYVFEVYNKSGLNKQYDRKTFDQMLSTFKFTK